MVDLGFPSLSRVAWSCKLLVLQRGEKSRLCVKTSSSLRGGPCGCQGSLSASEVKVEGAITVACKRIEALE